MTMMTPPPALTDAHRAILGRLDAHVERAVDALPEPRRAAVRRRIADGEGITLTCVSRAVVVTFAAAADDALDELVIALDLDELALLERLTSSPPTGPAH